jgi:hypothetical protein
MNIVMFIRMTRGVCMYCGSELLPPYDWKKQYCSDEECGERN